MTSSCPSLQPNQLWERSSSLYKRRGEFEASFYHSFFLHLPGYFCFSFLRHPDISWTCPTTGKVGLSAKSSEVFPTMVTQTARCESIPFYLSTIYLQTPSKSMAPSHLSSHRRLLGLVGTWQMGTIGKRTPRSQLLALSDFTACKIDLIVCKNSLFL